MRRILPLVLLLVAVKAHAIDDVLITKSGPGTVVAGTQLVYTITVKNGGTTTATGVAVDDPTPAGVLFSSNSGACASAFPCTIGTMSAGATAVITSTYDVPQTGSGTVTNTATVSSTSPDSTLSNNSSTVKTNIEQKADIEITKIGTASTLAGGQVDYTITVRNNGPSQAQTVVVIDNAPSVLTPVAIGGACDSFPCAIGPMVPGQTAVTTAKYNVSSSASGSFTNTASLNAATFDPNPSNNSSSVTTTVDCSSPAPTTFIPEANAIDVPLSGKLLWNVTDAVSFTVYLGPASANGCNTLLGTTKIPAIDYSALLPNTLYSWRVVSSTGPSCPEKSSACMSFRTKSTCNAAISALSPLGGVLSSPVEFKWTAVNAATDYTVYARVGNGNFSEVGRSTTTSLTASIPTDGDVQWFVVANAPGCSPQSQTASFTLCNKAGVPLARVVGEATTAKSYSVEWDAVPNAVGYEVDESINPFFVGTTTTRTDKTFVQYRHDATTPTAYYYRVRAFSACTTTASNNSPTVRIVILPLPKANDANPSTNVPAGSQELVTQQVLIPGIPGLTAFFTASTDRPWLTVRPTSGTLPPEGFTVEVVADPRTLPNGTFTATVIATITTPTTNGVGGNATTTTSKPISISLVTPVTPVQSRIAPGSDSLIIPSVGHLDGVNSHWQSDIRVTNVGSQSAKYALTFTPSAGTASGIQQTTISVGPGETTALDDIVRNWYGIGSLGDSANGMLEIRPADGLPFTAVASSRTYNVGANGTLGQFIPALPFSAFIGNASVLSLQQIAQSSLYRTNVGIVEASGNGASIVMSVFNASGAKLLDIPLTLNGGEQKQLNSILATNNIALTDGRIEVKVTGGDGKVTAYASVVDNATNDPLLVSGVPVNAAGASKYVLPGVADLTNALAAWRTDMRIFNPTLASQNATLILYPIGRATPLTANVTLQPGEVRALDDVVKSQFKSSNIGGAVHVTTSAQSNLIVTGRTYNQTTNGTYGQFIEAVTPAKAAGVNDRALHILQVEDSPRFRTNVGIAEVSGQPATVELLVFLPDSKVTPRFVYTLAPNEFAQFGLIHDLNLGNVYNARVSVRVIDGAGRVTAYGSVIDMTTQDPTYVPAQ